MIATSFLIDSSSDLQIARTGIKIRQVRFWPSFDYWHELPILEGLIDLGKCCPTDSEFIFDRIFIRLAGSEAEHSHKIFNEFDFGSDWTIHMRVTCHFVSVRH